MDPPRVVPLLVHAHQLGLWTPSLTVLMLILLELLTVALCVRGSTGRPMEALGGIYYEPLEGFNHHPFATLRYTEAVNRILDFIGRG